MTVDAENKNIIVATLQGGTLYTIRRNEDGSLGDVINGKIKGRENDEEIIVYETVGVAAQDLVAAKVIYDKAVEAGKGLRWGE